MKKLAASLCFILMCQMVVLAQLATCVLSNSTAILDDQGRPARGVKFFVRVYSGVVSGQLVQGREFNVETDARGFVRFSVVRGATITVSGEHPSFRTPVTVVVPNQAAYDLLLLANLGLTGPPPTGLGALGTANQIVGMNSGASALEYKTLVAGSNITITHGTGSVTVASSGAVAAGSGTELQFKSGSSLGAVTNSSASGANITLAGKITYTSAGVIADAGISNFGTYGVLTALNIAGTRRVGISDGTVASPVTGSSPAPSVTIERVDASSNAIGTTQALLVVAKKTGGTTFRTDAIAGYGYNDHTLGDIVGVSGLTQVTGNGSGAGNAFGLFGEATLSNTSGFGQAQGAEIDVVNNTGLTAPFTTNSLAIGSTLGTAIGCYIVGGSSSRCTVGIVFQGTSAWNQGIFFPTTSLGSNSIGIDFGYLVPSQLTTGAAIRLANDVYIAGFNGSAVQKKLLGINTSNLVAIDSDGLGTVFGAGIRPGAGTFASGIAQVYTDANSGLTVITKTGSTYDFGLFTPAGSAILRVPTGTTNLATVGSLLVGSGIALTAKAFAALGSPGNGQFEYCSDCAVTSGADNTCTSGGSGAFALRINSAWRCFALQN